jgi:hypothetical protein
MGNAAYMAHTLYVSENARIMGAAIVTIAEQNTATNPIQPIIVATI